MYGAFAPGVTVHLPSSPNVPRSSYEVAVPCMKYSVSLYPYVRLVRREHRVHRDVGRAAGDRADHRRDRDRGVQRTAPAARSSVVVDGGPGRRLARRRAPGRDEERQHARGRDRGPCVHRRLPLFERRRTLDDHRASGLRAARSGKLAPMDATTHGRSRSPSCSRCRSSSSRSCARSSLTETEIDGVTIHEGTLDGRDVVAIVTGMGTALATAGTSPRCSTRFRCAGCSWSASPARSRTRRRSARSCFPRSS